MTTKIAAVKANITLKLDKALLKEVRILAAEKDTSISALLSAFLQKLLRERDQFQAARASALRRMKKGYNLGFTPAKSRDELYER